MSVCLLVLSPVKFLVVPAIRMCKHDHQTFNSKHFVSIVVKLRPAVPRLTVAYTTTLRGNAGFRWDSFEKCQFALK